MENRRGKNAQNLKAENRGLLFQHIATHPKTSRTELAHVSELNKMTVSKIAADFIEKRYVVESTSIASRNNPIMLELSPDAPKIIGLLIRRNYVAAVLCNFHLDILSFESSELGDCTQESLLALARSLVDRMLRFGNILGIGIGSIGPVDVHNGIILDPPNFYGIHDVPIVEYFRSLYHLPVYLNYHYDCEALAEFYYGNGARYHDYLFLGIDAGLGLGIIVNNQLLSNFTGSGSNFGYLCVNFDDDTPRASLPSGFLGAYVSFEDADRAQIEDGISILSFALAGVCNILNSQAIIVGDAKGILSDADLQELETRLNNRIAQKYRHVDIHRSYRNGNFETASCAIGVIHRVFTGELMFCTDS